LGPTLQEGSAISTFGGIAGSTIASRAADVASGSWLDVVASDVDAVSEQRLFTRVVLEYHLIAAALVR
jgi:hypothetical protein